MIRLYAKASIALYRGFEKRMEGYAQQDNLRQKRIASLFLDSQKGKSKN